MIIFGTRPEVIKLAPVIKAFESPNYQKCFELTTVSTGQHSSMLDQALSVFNIHPSINLSVMRPSQNLSQLTSLLISEIDKTLASFIPDLVLVQGDTSTAFAGSLASFYQKIPVGHVEAGLRTWNLKFPFPEEYDRQSIGLVTKYHFAATAWARNNLLKEGKMPNSIYLTGNPVVDSLFLILKTTKPGSYLQSLREKVRNISNSDPKVILFTTHRRENQGDIMKGFFEVICKVLKNTKNTIIIFPMHKNPKVFEAFSSIIPSSIINNLQHGKKVIDKEWEYINRLILIEPMDYVNLVHLMNMSTLILTDSGGLQEEGTSLGKPVLILRTTTERPEAVHSGNAVLVGVDKDKIYSEVMSLLTNAQKFKQMSKPNMVYGNGTAGTQIASIIANALSEPSSEPLPTRSTLADGSKRPETDNFYHTAKNSSCIDLVVVLTVWKREALNNQFQLLLNQTAFQNRNVEIIVFQNANHINIDSIVHKWSPIFLAQRIKLTFVHSEIETRYYGRFLSPLTADTCHESYFILNDDNIAFGSRYYENMLRVVDDGFLCTRNGRAFSQTGLNSYHEDWSEISDFKYTLEVTYEKDVDIDFGGQIWAGKIKWLKDIWRYPPMTLVNGEDFWLSAILKTKFNIGTKIPMCPKPKLDYNQYGELCACSVPDSIDHKEAVVRKDDQKKDSRKRSMVLNSIMNHYHFRTLQQESPEKFSAFKNYGQKHLEKVFKPAPWSSNCLFWY